MIDLITQNVFYYDISGEEELMVAEADFTRSMQVRKGM
jgi:hypothetical protein